MKLFYNFNMIYLWIIARKSYLNFDENMMCQRTHLRTELFWTIHFISIYCRWMTIRLSVYNIMILDQQKSTSIRIFPEISTRIPTRYRSIRLPIFHVAVGIKYVPMQICLPVVFYDFTWLSCPHNSLMHLSKTIYWTHEIK